MAVLFSGGASGARFLFREEGNCENNYKIVAGLTDSPGVSGINVFRKRDLPVKVVDKANYPGSSSSDTRRESHYFQALAEEIGKFDPDLLLLSGFMQIVKDPLLTEYAGEIINVHPADLRLEEDGKRKYRGSDTVYRSILSGEDTIRSTVHFVTGEIDGGPILVVSGPVQIEREMVQNFERFQEGLIRDYADLLQEWMKWSCDGPAIRKALNLIGNGKVRVSQDQTLLKIRNEFVAGYYDMEKEKVITTGNTTSQNNLISE